MITSDFKKIIKENNILSIQGPTDKSFLNESQNIINNKMINLLALFHLNSIITYLVVTGTHPQQAGRHTHPLITTLSSNKHKITLQYIFFGLFPAKSFYYIKLQFQG